MTDFSFIRQGKTVFTVGIYIHHTMISRKHDVKKKNKNKATLLQNWF